MRDPEASVEQPGGRITQQALGREDLGLRAMQTLQGSSVHATLDRAHGGDTGGSTNRN